MTLYQKHRPKELKDVVGNEETITAVENILSRDREDIPHSFLFSGPTGCGKTTLARVLAKSLGCSDHDYKEVDSADFRGIDTVRDIRQKMVLSPIDGSCRAWLLDECHKMTNDAQNALLKALEDTPTHVYFMLATTNPEKLIPTVRNRCTLFQMESLSNRLLFRLLKRVSRAEKKRIPTEAINAIVKNSLGSPRTALVLLDKVIDSPKDKVEKMVERLASKENKVIDLCRSIWERKSWATVAKILQDIGDEDPEQVRRAILGYFDTILLGGDRPHAAIVIDSFRHNFYDSGKAGLHYACYEALFEMKREKGNESDIPF